MRTINFLKHSGDLAYELQFASIWGRDIKVACEGPVGFGARGRLVRLQSDVLLLDVTQPNPDVRTLYAMVSVTQSVVAFSCVPFLSVLIQRNVKCMAPWYQYVKEVRLGLNKI